MPPRSERQQYLLDDSSSTSAAPSDDYIAYTHGGDSASSSSATRSAARRKYIIAGVVGAVVVVLLLGIIGYAITAKKDEPPGLDVPAVATAYRLPSNVQPAWYDLTLRIDLDNSVFSGRVQTLVHVYNESMPAIVMHSMLLNITNVTITHVQGGGGGGGGTNGSSGGGETYTVVPASSYTYYVYGQDEGTGVQYLVLQGVGGWQFPVTAEGSGDGVVVEVAYGRSLPADTSSGLFQTSYTDGVSGQLVWMAATQFEPVHARRAFPCFDELQMKAYFRVQLDVKQGMVALSNGNMLRATDIGGGFQRVEFDWTERQSTYLMAFAVADYGYVNGTLIDASTPQPVNYLFREWGRKDRIQTSQNYTNRAFKVQEWFAEELNQPFPLKKQDQIAIPNKGGAMENYGLVTYYEAGIYFDEWTTSTVYQGAINVNAHELAHMLWGDLFTPSWWSDVWTKEGSAQFWSYVGMQAIMGDESDWQSDAQAVASYMESAFRADALPNTVALIDPSVLTPAQVSNHFGGPTYIKGASLLRMIRAILGDGKFLLACKRFLAFYKFSTANSSDLFTYFAAQWADGSGSTSQSELYDALMVWGSRRGFPLVTLTDVTSSSETTRQWQLKQEQYLLGDGQQWPVWVQYSSAGGFPAGAVWLNASNGYARGLSTPLNAPYVKLNFNRTSFYRVLYQPASVYDELVRGARGMVLQDRIGLIADTYWTQIDGYLESWPTVLNSTMLILARERDYPVWEAGIFVLSNMWSRVRYAVTNETDADGLRTIRRYMHMLLNYTAYEVVQWELNTREHPQSHLNGMMQVQFGSLACRFGLPPCIDLAVKNYAFWQGNGSVNSALPTANLRTLSIGYGARQMGGQTTQLFGYYLSSPKANAQQQATMYLEAAMIAATPDNVVNLLQYLDSLNGNGAAIPPLLYADTVPSVISRLTQLNDQAHPAMLAQLCSNTSTFDALIKPFDYTNANASRAAFNTIVNVVIGQIQTQAELDRAKSQLVTSDRMNALTGAGRDAVNAAVVTAQANVDFVKGNWPDMKAAMEAALASAGWAM